MLELKNNPVKEMELLYSNVKGYYESVWQKANPVKRKKQIKRFLVGHLMWGKIFKNGPNKIFRVQPLRNL